MKKKKEEIRKKKDKREVYSMVTSRNLVVLLFSFFILLFSFSCDLFQPADPDYIKKLDEEVAWANAAKLAVTVVYPQEWGSSPQAGTGRCFDNKRTDQNPRQGYAFTVQFNPNAAYGDAQWRAYRTIDLPADSDWYINEVSINNRLNELDTAGKRLSESEIVFSPPLGNASTITINISEAVTIIPYSQKQPRIINSNPPITAKAPDYKRAPNNPIVITFAAPVNSDTLKFEDGLISITGKNPATGEVIYLSPNMGGLFTNIQYDPETYTVTIQSGGNIPEGIIVEVTLGTNIKSAGGTLGFAEAITFSYLTDSSAQQITAWNAFYDGKEITVNWTSTMTPIVKYHLNNNSPMLAETSDTGFTIPNVFPTNSSGVTAGQSVSNVDRYTITLELEDDIATIIMYNIPGMEINNDDFVLINRSNIAELYKQENLAKNLILTENIELNGHIPIGSAAEGVEFTGNFYGNGYTVTINSFVEDIAEYTDIGLFGMTENALIRDLKTMFAKMNLNGASSTTNVGSIIGLANGKTEILNCIVEVVEGDDISFTVTANAKTYMGGIVGYLDGTSYIQNSLAALNVTLTTSNSYDLYTGGVIGYGNSTGTLSAITAVNTVSMNKTGGTGGENFLGGIAGSIVNTNLNDCEFIGTINIPNTFNASGETYIGGIAGLVGTNEFRVNIVDAIASGNLILRNNGTGYIYLGGVAGKATATTTAWGANNIPVFTRCEYRDGSIEITAGTGSSGQYIGGVAGSTSHNVAFNDCASRAGSIRIQTESSAGVVNIGGFIGLSSGFTAYNRCYSGSDIEVIFRASNNYFNVGGFVGELAGSYDGGGSNIIGCYAAGSVSLRVDNPSGGELKTGGFIGYMSTASASARDCYALGNVIVENTGSTGIITYTGGFTGVADNSMHYFFRCFAAGIVSVRAQLGDIYIGGFIGRHHVGTSSWTYRINNCAILGASITVRSESTPSLNRVLGYTNAWGIPFCSDNYAIDTMKIEIGDYNDVYIEPVYRNTISDNTDWNGATANASNFHNPVFWQETLRYAYMDGFVEKVSPPLKEEINNPNLYWDFSTVASRGYPILKGVGGQ